MRIKSVPSRRLSFLAAATSVVAALAWIAPALILNNFAVWCVAGPPFIALAVVFYLRGRRIPSAARNGDS